MVSSKTIKLRCQKFPDVQLPAVMTIAGSDSSGGAGIEADLKTFAAHKVYGLTCITALTAQNTMGVVSIENTKKEQFRNMLQLNCQDFIYGYHDDESGDLTVPLKVIKTGMLTSELIDIISEFLPIFQKYNVRLVVDTVMISTSGANLFDKAGMTKCLNSIIANAYLLTPNFPEACTLFELSTNLKFDKSSIKNIEDFKNFVPKLQQQLGCENILVKGGHIPFNNNYEIGDSNAKILIDILYQSKTDTLILFESTYIDSKNTHGTGCTLASSIASNLAKKIDLVESISLSIDYVHRGIQLTNSLGHGNGPLNHLIPTFNNTNSIDNGQNDENLLDSTNQSFYEYLKCHWKVSEDWKVYTNHKFIEKLATNQLPFEQFLYYLKQDYYYLLNYAQVHHIAAEKAPNQYQKELQYKIIEEINHEIENHKKKLNDEYGIKYTQLDLDHQLKPGKACLAYCDYLLKISQQEDFLGIKVAVAPCLHGYKEAGDYGIKIRANFDTSILNQLSTAKQSQTYDNWLNDYGSSWYDEAHKIGIETLQFLRNSNQISESRIESLISIFSHVTKLEIDFWDEVLSI